MLAIPKIEGPQPPTARTQRREDALSRLIEHEDIHPLKRPPQDIQFTVGTHDLFGLSRFVQIGEPPLKLFLEARQSSPRYRPARSGSAAVEYGPLPGSDAGAA